MFVDRVKVLVKAGDGGRGCLSFRREKFVPRGGPDGGNGGSGGDVVLEATTSQNTLLPLRYHTEYRARRGQHGGSSNKVGRSASHLVIPVPAGTIAIDIDTNETLGEVIEPGDQLIVARGGRGGRGNKAFLSNRNRAPRRADPGETGEERWLRLDLKLIADVGLLGAPNAGKSTLLSRISAARPKVAAFPFTTITPVLGVVDVGDASFVAADIPGIIEGAHTGSGLGLDFLRHVQRTRVLLHLVDASSGAQPVADLRAVRKEVGQWDVSLIERPQLVVATKRDAVQQDDEDVDPLVALRREAGLLGLEVVAISAVRGDGLEELKRKALALLESAPPRESPGPTPAETSRPGGPDGPRDRSIDEPTNGSNQDDS
jgi:GTP-binding protein